MIELPVLLSKPAPAFRASRDVVERQATAISDSSMLCTAFDTVPELLMVLNSHRQIVHANRALRDLFKQEKLNGLLGLRPGEAFQCIRSKETPAGCGTSEACRACGAVKAILKSQEGSGRASEECRMTLRKDSHTESLDLQVSAVSFTHANELYTVCVLQDVGDQKRRQLLEKIFFHDILNTAGALVSVGELIEDSATGGPVQDIMKRAFRMAGTMIEQIHSQRSLVEAENGELTVRLARKDLAQFLYEVMEQARSHDEFRAVALMLDPPPPESIETDFTLLARVVGNMVKNALEASSPGETVRVTARFSPELEILVHNPGVMPEAARLQVFQRSFSTKGGGRGLGTYSMKLLGERYLKGRVDFSTVHGEGTTFRIQLPLHPLQ